MNLQGILIVVSGFSGSGKGTIMKELVKRYDSYALSVSATTRQPREGEVDGREYFFKTREEFEKMIKDGELLEHTEYCGNYYGTPKQTVLDALELGQNVVLKIEIEGAENVKKLIPEAVLIFILPPSMQELSRRLHKRGTEDEETIAKRLKQAEKEISFAEKYDYVIVNGDLDKAVRDLVSIVNAESFRTYRNKELADALKNNKTIEQA